MIPFICRFIVNEHTYFSFLYLLLVVQDSDCCSIGIAQWALHTGSVSNLFQYSKKFLLLNRMAVFQYSQCFQNIE